MARSPMRAGAMDRRIKLLRRETVRTSSGESYAEYVEHAEVYAAKWPVRARETEQGDALIGQAELRFMIRWRDDVSITMRVVCDGAVYELVGIEEIGRREGLYLYARGVQD